MKRTTLLVTAAVLAFSWQAAEAQTRPGVDQSRARPIQKAPRTGQRPATKPAAVTAAQPFTPFVVQRVRVDGSSAPVELIAAATEPFVGKLMDEAALERLTQAVARIYENSDSALYTVVAPEQDFAGGEVRLVVLEGHIAEVAVDADPPGQDLSLIDAYATRLKAEQPLRRPTLERYTSLIRDIPGAKAEMELLQTETPGATRLKVGLKQKRFDGGVSVNTRGAALLGRTQVALDGYWNGMLTQGDQAHVTLAAPTDLKRFQYYALAYRGPLNGDGTRGAVNAGYLRTRPKGAAVSGSATMGGVEVRHPLIRGYKQNLYLSGGLDMLDSRNALFGRTVSDERTRAARLGVGWSRTGDRTVTGAQAGASLGLDAFGARAADPQLADVDFRKLGIAVSHDRVLTPSWAARLRLAGQATADRLPASELFALGGDDYGRAYEASSLVGDYGYAGSAELAWIPEDAPKAVAGSEVYGFVDGGRVWAKSRLGGRASDAALASAGGGVRLALFSKTVLGLEGAHAIDPPPGGEREWRLIFSLRTILD